MRRTIVANKTKHDIIKQKGRREQQQHPQIGLGHLKYSLVCSQQAGKRCSPKQAQEQKQNSKTDAKQQSMSKNRAAFIIVFALSKCKTGGTSNAQHQSCPMDKVIDRNRKVQSSKAAAAQAL